MQSWLCRLQFLMTVRELDKLRHQYRDAITDAANVLATLQVLEPDAFKYVSSFWQSRLFSSLQHVEERTDYVIDRRVSGKQIGDR